MGRKEPNRILLYLAVSTETTWNFYTDDQTDLKIGELDCFILDFQSRLILSWSAEIKTESSFVLIPTDLAI